MAEREILFRGKSADVWHYGNLIQTTNKTYISTNGEAFPVQVMPETVGQFTGLTDKNGKRIFEGDIIQSTETKETAVVQWFPEHSAFMVWCKSSNEVGFLYECTKSIIEVIGNIHDNPDMLKKASKPVAQDVLASATDEGEEYIMGFTLMQG